MALATGWWMRMKNKPMFFQISFLFTILVVLIGLIVSTMVPTTLRSFFTDEIYRTIEESQEMTTRINRNGMMMGGGQAMRSVQHVFLDENGIIIMGGRTFTDNALKLFYNQAISQKEAAKRYEVDLEEKSLLYVISKKELGGVPVLQISFMMDTYRSELVSELLKKIYLILLIALAAGMVLSFLFARWLIKPIYSMKESVLKYANRKWEEPFILNRGDELGVLAASIEKMRKQLKEQDESQQFLLQNVSHDLKTPVMVIRSYAEALKEGIYPAGTPEGTGEIIEKEAASLEKKVKDLLYLTKLDYVSRIGQQFELIKVKPLVSELVDRLHPFHPQIKIALNVDESVLNGNLEQITVLLENLIENAFKFANTKIELSALSVEDSLFITCFNDGKGIPEDMIKKVFQPFIKGENGSFGLGLAIISQITELHKGEINVNNEKDGVSFYLKFPLHRCAVQKG
jgi:two-component system sensor histidine kinase CssS